jgi:hypothetical protein
MLLSIIYFMDPAPSGKALPTRNWEEFLGTVIALFTLTLPLTAIATYAPSTPPPAAQVAHEPAVAMN